MNVRSCNSQYGAVGMLSLCCDFIPDMEYVIATILTNNFGDFNGFW